MALRIGEDPQMAVAEVASARDCGDGLSQSMLEDLYKLLAGGARGTASGAFEFSASE